MRFKASKFTFLIFLLFAYCYSISAQTELTDDFDIHYQYYTRTAKDLIIPYDLSANAITFMVQGASGGFVTIGDCKANGGLGAVATATFVIGTGENQLPPGTPIRFIVSEAGASQDQDAIIGSTWGAGGGGGGSAVLAYLNDTWVILAVAGGGGGAYQGMFAFACVDKQNGQGGRSGTSGGSGEGSLAGSGGSGGQGGEGGGDIGDGDLSGGGGGAFSNGTGGGCREGALGYPSGGIGGAQGFCADIIIPINYAKGGWGFGGGGAGDETGGGGGGYSGGGGGGLTNNGGGGGSIVHPSAMESTITAGGNSGSLLNGVIGYQFLDVCTAVISGFEYVNLICSEDGQGRIQLIHDLDPANYCAAELSFRLLPENGHKHMGNGLFREVKPGNYTAQVVHTETGFVMNSFSLTAAVSTVAPVALCKDATVTLNNGAYSNANFHQLINNGSYSDCDDGLILSASQTSFDCNDLGTVPVTLTVSATNNLSSSCQANVTVKLSSSDVPVAKCYANRTFNLSHKGLLTLVNSDINDGSITGACFTSMTVSPNSFDCDDLGDHIVTLTVNAGANINSTCTSVVTITDNLKPEARCRTPNPISLDDTGGASITYLDVDGNSASNNCTDLTYSVSKSSFDCSNVGPNQVTLTVTDGHGNSSSCTSTVTIQENAAPLANCRDITVSLDENGAYILDPAELDDGSSDICAFDLSASQTSFDCSDIGTSSVTLTVTDEHGAQSSCTADVTVEDNLPPTAVCLNYTVSILPNVGFYSIAHFTTAATWQSTDNCSGALSRKLLSSSFLTCDDLGPNEITYQVTDQHNNSSTCVSTFTLEDNTAPFAYCKDVSVQLEEDNRINLPAQAVDDESYDNCSITNYALSQSSFDCSHLGENVVTLTVTDQNGLTSSCQATITVQEGINSCNHPPVAVCRDITVHADTNCEGAAAAADFDGGSTDADLDALTFSVDPAGPYPQGVTSVTLTVSDGQAGDNCAAKITVVTETAIQTAAHAKIWPPDYSYQTYTVGQMVSGLSGACDGGVDDIWIESVASDEAEDHSTSYDGTTLNDIVISSDCRSVQVRRERMSNGNGRVYTVILAYQIPGDEIVYAGYEISVPRWPWGWYSTAINDGVAYSVTCESFANSAMTLEAVRPASSMELTPVSKGRHETASDVTVFPNPFYHETTIALELPEARRTIIEILNLRGQVIKRLPAQDLPAGHHQFRWDGAGDSGEKAPSGMYFIRIGMGTENLLRKVLLQNF